ncbi:dual specificity protein phosphatase [Trichocoleus sp. FACHB-262]|uniref:dual specificity protein phosphatase family protein n=1 Tax=Trichocoleus sp. FACHB-262 TaxID=2692869 RepID=UPI001686E178|nr:dual specificity protein phosphatase [Trichocoleus sp. FACHB-262]MBD2122310.1 dual specificity protein phosphatase family protein [Trichocoleus sp. FACHB-262]
MGQHRENQVRQVLRQVQRLIKTIWFRLQGWLSGKPRQRSFYQRQTPFSWVIPGRLAVGGLPQAEDHPRLVAANIKVVLSLCAEIEGCLPEKIIQDFNCLRFIVPDRYYTTQLEVHQLAKAVEIVHQSVQNQLPIYVHCLAGIERSPTVCLAYLCLYQNLELWEALNWLKQVHPSTMPNESQLRTLREFLQVRQN